MDTTIEENEIRWDSTIKKPEGNNVLVHLQTETTYALYLQIPSIGMMLKSFLAALSEECALDLSLHDLELRFLHQENWVLFSRVNKIGVKPCDVVHVLVKKVYISTILLFFNIHFFRKVYKFHSRKLNR